jgi:hypothetical protein
VARSSRSARCAALSFALIDCVFVGDGGFASQPTLIGEGGWSMARSSSTRIVERCCPEQRGRALCQMLPLQHLPDRARSSAHACLCSACATSIMATSTKCPICREKIASTTAFRLA